MPDNFGPQQSRVISPAARSWDETVFLTGVPFLTSELNFIGQIASLKSQEALGTIIPSGWMKVGDVFDIGNLSPSDLIVAENSALSGQVLTSPSYSVNSFKLISNNTSNIAVVNGWKIVVQGSNAPTPDDTNNYITMPDISSHRIDFVFLEVWKELVDYTDIVYPYGNVLATPIPTPTSSAEIFYNTINIETSKRVQIRYRIRSQMSSTNPGISLVVNPEGFGPGVNPVGGRGPGNYNTQYEFVNQSPLDPGLWISQPISGPGTKTQAQMQSDLNTVDGNVYAIPMFAVYRREPWSISIPFSFLNPHVAKAEKISSFISDRPDNHLLDVIYKEDIIDLRHQVMSPGQDLNAIAKKTFRKIISGELTSIKGSGTGSDGSRIDLSGGSTLLKADRIDTGSPSDPLMGSPSAVTAGTFKRRAYCNSDIIHKANVYEQTTSSQWQSGNTFLAVLVPSNVPAVVVSIDGFYSTTIDQTGSHMGMNSLVTGITYPPISNTNNKSVQFTVTGSSNITSFPAPASIFIEYTVEYQPSIDGFKDVPRDFLEVREVGTALPIATRDTVVPIRGQSISVTDFVRYAGGNYTDNYQFGHELVLFRTLIPPSPFQSTNIGSADFYGYNVIGIKSIQRQKLDGSYGTYQSFNVTRTGTVYAITLISGIDEPTTQPNIKITLYTANKFFELSKQGRGVIDTYEMKEVTAQAEPPGSTNYFIDTGVEPIIAIGTFAVSIDGVVTGAAYAFKGVGTQQLITLNNPFSPTAGDNINSNLPILSSSGYQTNIGLPTKVKIIANGLAPGDIINVPVLVHSYVPIGDGYAFFYNMNPYQGNITQELTGKIESEGPAAITSEGSGSVTLLTYDGGTSVFSKGNRDVVGIGTEWLSFVQTNDYIRIPGSYSAYRVDSVQSDTELTLTEPYVESSTSNPIIGEVYEVFRLDVSRSGFTNVIDRMPSLLLQDYNGESVLLNFSNFQMSYVDTSPLKKIQDPLETTPNDFSLGIQNAAVRGRNGVVLTHGQNTIYKIGSFSPGIEYLPTQPLFGSNYKKVFQSYIFNNGNTGRLYLAIISGETGNTSQGTSISSNTLNDTVDIFELIGRPLYK